MIKFVERDFIPIILGGDITAYSHARSFYEAYQIKSVALSVRSSQLITGSSLIEHIVVPQLEETDVLLAELNKLAERFKEKKLLVLACGDWYVRILSENKDKLEPRFIIPYIDVDLLDRLVLKDSFYEICDEVGVTYPHTMVVDLSKKWENEAEIPLTFPLVAKPASSAEYHYAEFEGKKKVFIFDTREELNEMFKNLQNSDYSYKFLLQEFIPGDFTNMRVLTCYCDKNSDVRFASLGQTLLEDPGDFGIGNPVVIINRVNNSIVEEAARLLKHVGYTGFANFDIKHDPRTGKNHFFEINARLGRSNYYVTGSGFNVEPWMVNDLIYSKPFDHERVIADNTKSLYTVVPRSVIEYYVKDPALLAEVKELYQTGNAINPIDFKGENFKRRLYVPYFMHKQRKRFMRLLEHE